MDGNNDSLPLLSIVIPTFNRKGYLRECLERVLAQIEEDNEILVCDNASSDGTENMMQEYCRLHSCMRYLRNAVNIGSEANIMRCFRESHGRFIHLLADDDILLPGAISRVEQTIRECGDTLSFLCLNSRNFQGPFRDERCTKPRFDMSENAVFTDKNQFLRYIGIYATFISGMVFNRSALGRLEDLEQYIGTYLLPAHAVLRCIGVGKKCVLVAHPCIAARGGNGGGYNLYRVFACEWKRALFETGLRNGFHRGCMKTVYAHTIRDFLRGWVVQMRITNTAYDSSGAILLFKMTWTYPSAWIHLYPFLVMPRWLVRGIARVRDWARAQNPVNGTGGSPVEKS